MLTLCLSLLLLITNNSNNSQITDKKEKVMKFELIQLPYAANALEPVISKETIGFHHGKHLQTYVNNLNNLIQGTKFENATLEQIVAESDGAIFNNAGQTLNHNLYFTQFSPLWRWQTDRRPRQSDRRDLGIVRKLPERIRSCRNRSIRLRMGMAG